MFNRKTILVLAVLACIASQTSAFAQELSSSLRRDSIGRLHYIPAAETRTLMKAEDIDHNGNWIVPTEVLKM